MRTLSFVSKKALFINVHKRVPTMYKRTQLAEVRNLKMKDSKKTQKMNQFHNDEL